ncbi:MAG TPA: RagB/SusD family nutrient uptake outer membrane protein, partial [archaeon]|nr:RagB/SusD family nutrient uptake outer membrane protein [archaeon]
PKGIGDANGIDFMRVRYADILLSLAEALNELNGPNQVSIDLINQIRVRAGTNIVQLSDFSTKESLRDHLLKERLWEFYYEAMEREDLLRHGKFISNAQARGINAQDYHKVFPIPQSEVDTNPMIVQNPGY